MKNIKGQLAKIKFGCKKYSPEILLGTGLVTGTACAIFTGKSSIKAAHTTTLMKLNKKDLDDSLDANEISEEEYNMAIKNVYRKYAIELAKEYAIPATLYIATIASIFGSYKIQKNRQLALSAALSSCTAAYAALVARVKNAAENDLSAKDIVNGTVVEVNEDGVIEKKIDKPVIDTSMYSFRFDKYSTVWEKDRFQNICTLKNEETWANDVLRLQGYLFLNDVLARLGLPKTKAGQIVGWKLNSNGDGYVDFRIKDCAEYTSSLFDDNAWDLDFNVDGDILSTFTDVEYV